jgi:uncharacterized phiE125 gp8 family phage protein
MILLYNMNYFRGRYKVVTQQPATNIISIAELKNRLKIPSNITSVDSTLTDSLNAAVDEFMDYTQSGLLDTVFSCDLYGFSNTNIRYTDRNELYLYQNNIHTLNSVKYAKDGVLTTISQDVYNFTKQAYKATLSLKSNQKWIDASDIDEQYNNDPLGVVKVEFVSGFGATAAEIPAKIKKALVSYVIYYYNNTGDCGDCGGEASQFYSLISEYKYYSQLDL